MFDSPAVLHKPGLFVTGTDTDVGKTVITCAIAAALRAEESRARVGVCKPMATGCRHDREGLVSEDAEALAHFADCRLPLEIINPIRYALAVSPAVASEVGGTPMDWEALKRSLTILDEGHDVILVEGVGGILAPIDSQNPQVTVLDLVAALKYPVVVVCRAGLGTLNHTTMTVRLLRAAGCEIAGLVVNGYIADSSRTLARNEDASMVTNRHWLERMNSAPILATVPACPINEVAPQRGLIPPAILEAVAATYWSDVVGTPTIGG